MGVGVSMPCEGHRNMVRSGVKTGEPLVCWAGLERWLPELEGSCEDLESGSCQQLVVPLHCLSDC